MQIHLTESEIVRFWSRVQKTDSCWFHAGARHNFGYAKVKLGALLYAHRVAWVLASGEQIPTGDEICHTCDTPACVRNDDPGVYLVDGVEYPRWGHLFRAPRLANMADMAAKARSTLGDRNPARLYPERVQRGDRHWSHRTPDLVRIGSQHHAAKLTEDTVLAIRSRFSSGDVTQRQLALDFEIGFKHINDIVKRRSWRHI